MNRNPSAHLFNGRTAMLLLSIGRLTFQVTRIDILLRIPHIGDFCLSLLREGHPLGGRRFFFERWDDDRMGYPTVW